MQWESGETNISVEQLEKAANLLESLDISLMNLRYDQLNKFEILSQTYRMLQKVLITLNRPEEALKWAEKLRQYKDNSSDDGFSYSEIIDKQRGVVLYFRY